jgi:hypothetical protein
VCAGGAGRDKDGQTADQLLCQSNALIGGHVLMSVLLFTGPKRRGALNLDGFRSDDDSSGSDKEKGTVVKESDDMFALETSGAATAAKPKKTKRMLKEEELKEEWEEDPDDLHDDSAEMQKIRVGDGGEDEEGEMAEVGIEPFNLKRELEEGCVPCRCQMDRARSHCSCLVAVLTKTACTYKRRTTAVCMTTGSKE